MSQVNVIEALRGGLVVSCQAPAGTGLDEPGVISAMAEAAASQGAVGLRINGALKIAACKSRTNLPIIGIEKLVIEGAAVYITPTFESAARVALADIIAVDATGRKRPDGSNLGDLIQRIRKDLKRPVMADVSTLDEGLRAVDLGADLVATTLCGYTAETRKESLPALGLIEAMAKKINIPVICEGGVSRPEELAEALNRGAHAVVVGTAITGITELTAKFASSARIRNRVSG